jgi:hypothetical protein
MPEENTDIYVQINSRGIMLLGRVQEPDFLLIAKLRPFDEARHILGIVLEKRVEDKVTVVNAAPAEDHRQ